MYRVSMLYMYQQVNTSSWSVSNFMGGFFFGGGRGIGYTGGSTFRKNENGKKLNFSNKNVAG